MCSRTSPNNHVEVRRLDLLNKLNSSLSAAGAHQQALLERVVVVVGSGGGGGRHWVEAGSERGGSKVGRSWVASELKVAGM